MAYQRVVLKISGEMFCKPGHFGVTPSELLPLAEQISEIQQSGCKLAVVVGAGNLIRGKELELLDFDRIRADQMGMIATVVNALALEASLTKLSVPVKLFSAVAVEGFVEPHNPRLARESFDSGDVVLLAGGTGNPFVTTDTAAALRAAELGADVLLKGTKVEGIYSADPNACRDAKRYDRISYAEVLEEDLGFMDAAAVAICRERRIPILVFSLRPLSNMILAVRGEEIGTLVWSGKDGP
jgi:uridylate kinase